MQNLLTLLDRPGIWLGCEKNTVQRCAIVYPQTIQVHSYELTMVVTRYVKYGRVKKIAIFNQYLALSRKRYKIVIVTMEDE